MSGTFAKGAMIGLRGPVRDFGAERISRGSHIERLFLFSEGAGKDALSDFITNLCHEFLLKFTQLFTSKFLSAEQSKEFDVRHVRFDFEKQRWLNDRYLLPIFKSDYVLLTPVDLLTQSVPWINRPDLFERFGGMLDAMSDNQLRGNVNTFLRQKLARPPNYPRDKEYRPSKKDVRSAYARALELYPDLANWYVFVKESTADEAVAQSKRRVSRAEELYRFRVLEFLASTLRPSAFFDVDVDNAQELLSIFGAAIEKNGSSLFLGDEGLVDELSADDVKLICTLVWRADGNDNRRLPEFRFVYDPKSASQFESALASDPKRRGMLVITTDRGKKSRIKLLADNFNLTEIVVASISQDSMKGPEVGSIFISYTKSDEDWARWIGRVLMSAGYEVTAQFKDFLPGSNFVERMDQAIQNTDRTVAVLSRDYLESRFAAAEWQAAFRDDPLGQLRKLVPVRIAKVTVSGLLGSIVYADLMGLSEESATAVLLGAISAESRPSLSSVDAEFPGSSKGTDEYQSFLERIPRTFKKRASVADAPKRLQLAMTIGTLSTNQVNVLIYALNPPDNEIPPVSAPAKDRAAALLDWASRVNIDLSEIEELINSLQG